MVNRTIKYVRKIAIGIVGVALVLVGIPLLPLPGPGLLVILLGLFVLSWEFEWAKKHFERLKRKLNEVQNKAKKRQAELKDNRK